MTELAGRTAIVTGAASGIGRDIAETLAAAGADVLFAASSAHALEADVAAPDLADRLAAWLGDRGLDHLVAAAGVQVRTAAVDIAEDDWARLLDVNLSSFYRMVRRLVRPLQRGTGGRPGSVLAISSMSADRAVPGIVPYGSVKAALSHLVRGLAAELGTTGPRVNAIAPGYIVTEMTAEMLAQPENHDRILARTPMGRFGQPADVTGPALFLLSDAAGFVTGHTLPVDGGYALV